MSLDTQPMSLDALGGSGLDEFRVQAPVELRALLKRVQDGNVAVNLNASSGALYTTTIWACDFARNAITLSADANDPRLQALVEADEVVAVSYLDNVKIQFDLHGLVLVRGGNSSALQAPMPHVIYRFQRRSSYRVRTIASASPVARMRHPHVAGMPLALRVIDVSLGGCALFLPTDVPPMHAGADIAAVGFELDADTRFEARLHVHHLIPLGDEARGSRLGCSMVKLSRDAERVLQRYIDQTQKRRRLFVLE